jgi:hypothetical protein
MSWAKPPRICSSELGFDQGFRLSWRPRPDDESVSSFEKMRRCPGASWGRRKIILGNLKIPIDVIPTMRYILLVLFNEGPLSRSDPSAGRAKAGWTGGPGPADGWWPRWSAGRRCALRHWARAVHLAARGGYVIPASRVPAWCPSASRRSTPSRRSRGTGKPRTLCAARTWKLGCLKFEFRNFASKPATADLDAQARNPKSLYRGWMLNANTGVMDSGLARRARPGMTSCVDEQNKKPELAPGLSAH